MYIPFIFFFAINETVNYANS